jgi:hypothetical protein
MPQLITSSTLFDLSTDAYSELWILPRLYSLITNRDPTFYPAELAHRQSGSRGFFGNFEKLHDWFNVWCEYTEISEGDYNPQPAPHILITNTSF